MQQPGAEKHPEHTERNSNDDRGSLSPQHKEGWKEKQLRHEVLPVDVDASPDITKTCRQKELVVSSWQIKSEKMQQAGDHMKLTGDLQIKCVVRHYKNGNLLYILQVVDIRHQVRANDSINQQMRKSSDDPDNTSLINLPLVRSIPAVQERSVVNHWKKRKAGIRQHEEIRDRGDWWWQLSRMANFVRKQQQSKHQYRTCNWPERQWNAAAKIDQRRDSCEQQHCTECKSDGKVQDPNTQSADPDDT